MNRIERIVDSFREEPLGTTILLGGLLAVGAVFTWMTNARLRHRRQHPQGLNSSPDTPVSILFTDEDTH